MQDAVATTGPEPPQLAKRAVGLSRASWIVRVIEAMGPREGRTVVLRIAGPLGGHGNPHFYLTYCDAFRTSAWLEHRT